MGYIIMTGLFLAAFFGLLPFWGVILGVVLAAVLQAYGGNSARPTKFSSSLATLVLTVLLLGGGIFWFGPEKLAELWKSATQEEEPPDQPAADPETPAAPNNSVGRNTRAMAPSGQSQASGLVASIDASQFPVKVLLASQPILVEFAQPGCHVCEEMQPIVQELAAEYKGLATIYKVDIAGNQDLQKAYDINLTPTFVVFHEGKEVHRFTGETEKQMLSTALLLETK